MKFFEKHGCGSALYWCHAAILGQGYLYTLCSPPLVSRDETSACLHYTSLLSLLPVLQLQSTWSTYSTSRFILFLCFLLSVNGPYLEYRFSYSGVCLSTGLEHFKPLTLVVHLFITKCSRNHWNLV